jgi:hypothetical protein
MKYPGEALPAEGESESYLPLFQHCRHAGLDAGKTLTAEISTSIRDRTDGSAYGWLDDFGNRIGRAIERANVHTLSADGKLVALYRARAASSNAAIAL